MVAVKVLGEKRGSCVELEDEKTTKIETQEPLVP